jgi:hypothetical protein
VGIVAAIWVLGMLSVGVRLHEAIHWWWVRRQARGR